MAKTRKKNIEKIDVAKFTNLMKLHLQIAVERYSYIQNEYDAFKNRPYDSNDDFVVEYTDFYALKASLRDFSNPDVKRIYFDLLKKQRKPVESPEIIAKAFKHIVHMELGIWIGDHISFCSKIAHTVDTSIPIYDSRIKEYLGKVYNVPDNYNDIKKWYYSSDNNIKKDQSEIINWFKNSSFNQFCPDISDIKILDTVIFIWHKYYDGN